MKKLFYISNSLPYSPNGSGLFAANILKCLKNRFKIIAISLGNNYCTKKELTQIHKNLKKEKIQFYEIDKNIEIKKDIISIKKLFSNNYYKYNSIVKSEEFISKISIKKKDIILSYGNVAILSAKNIKCKKIAVFEDLENQALIYRTKLSINKLNFLKKILKLIILKIYFRNYYSWLQKISKNYKIKYTLSPFDYNILKKFFYLKILPIPIEVQKKIDKRINKKLFFISMLGSHVTKDFQGIILLNKFLLPMLKEKKLLNKVKINLIMRTNKKILPEIKNILKNKHLNLCQYTKNNINNTDLLFYPSKYPVGIRTKVLFALSKSWFVATSQNIKKCIPGLRDLYNCIMSDDPTSLCKKIVKIIQNKEKFSFIVSNGRKLLNNYSKNKFLNVLINDLKILK